MTPQEIKREQAFKKWYLSGPGFCGNCGEGLGTKTKEEVELFGKCKCGSKY